MANDDDALPQGQARDDTVGEGHEKMEVEETKEEASQENETTMDNEEEEEEELKDDDDDETAHANDDGQNREEQDDDDSDAAKRDAGDPEKEEEESSQKEVAATDKPAAVILTRPIKKARTAYFIFADEKRAEVQAANPGQGVAVQARATGQLWSALSAEDRSVYQNTAAQERERVAQELEEWTAAGGVFPAASDAEPGDALVLPVARIRKIAKLDPDVKGLSKEAALMITKLGELFTAKLGHQAMSVAQLQNRRKLLPEDVAQVCSTKEQFLFLREDVKDLMREQLVERRKGEMAKKKDASVEASAVASNPLTSYFAAK